MKLKTKRERPPSASASPGSGKIRRHSSHHSHILTKKSPKRKRNLRKASLVSAADSKRVRAMLKIG